MFLVDSHCHLDALDYEKQQTNVDDVLAKAKANDVNFCLAVSTTLAGYQHLADWIGDRKDVGLSCGVHPLNLDEGFDAEHFWQCAKDPRVIALGETGLDYYYQQDNKKEQQAVFCEHIRASGELNKPLIVHTRDAKADTLQLLKSENAQKGRGVLHCFTEDLDTAKQLLDLDFYISFSGIVTFKNAESLREVARYVPLDRMLIETDSPYLAPVPYRGKENQPAYVRAVAEYLAVLKGVELSELARATTQNFCQLFNVNLNQEKAHHG